MDLHWVGMVWSYIANIVQMLGTILVVASLRRWALVHKKQKKISDHNTCYISTGIWTSCCTGNHKPAGTTRRATTWRVSYQSRVEARRTGWVHDTSQHNSIESDARGGSMHKFNAIWHFSVTICGKLFFWLQGSQSTSLSQPQESLPDSAFMKLLLTMFEQLSGLKINFHKSELFCFGAAKEVQQDYMNIFGCNVGEAPFTYLGIPLHYKWISNKDWKVIEDRFERKLSTWKSKLLSYGGSHTLINSVLGNLSVYVLSFFEIPKEVKKVKSL